MSTILDKYLWIITNNILKEQVFYLWNIWNNIYCYIWPILIITSNLTSEEMLKFIGMNFINTHLRIQNWKTFNTIAHTSGVISFCMKLCIIHGAFQIPLDGTILKWNTGKALGSFIVKKNICDRDPKWGTINQNMW